MNFLQKVILFFRRNKWSLPNVGDLIEVLLDCPVEKSLPDDKIITYSGGLQNVARLEPITVRGKSYFANCCGTKTHLHFALQTPSLAKTNSWLAWCQVIYIKKKGVWKTIAGWKL